MTQWQTNKMSAYVIYETQQLIVKNMKEHFTMPNKCNQCQHNFNILSKNNYSTALDIVRNRYGERVALLFELKIPIAYCHDSNIDGICMDCSQKS